MTLQHFSCLTMNLTTCVAVTITVIAGTGLRAAEPG